MGLTGDGEARLSEFLDWVGLSGSSEARARDFRRVASSLLELADGGRVTESHILKLIDAHSEGPAAKVEVGLIEDVGEQILRFQAARKASAATPIVPTANAPARPARASTSQPFVPRPEERVAGELRPPVAASATPGVPSVVSFATGSSPPRPPSAQSGPASEPPPRTPSSPPPERSPSLPPSSPSPPPSSPSLAPSSPSLPPSSPSLAPSTPSSATRRSATLFRCWRCKIMVESDANGCCPRCGTPAPKISSAQANIVEPARRRWLLPAGVLAGVAVVALLAAPPLLERMHHPSELVDGDFRSAHLGVRLQFPDGWRHLDEGDRAPSGGLDRLAEVFRDPLSVRSSRFFRGSAGDPAAELLLVVGSRATELGDAAFAAWAQAAADAPDKLEAPIRELTSVRNLRLFQCTAGATVPHAGLRCVGAASRTTAYVYVFPAHGNVTLAVFLSRAGPEATLAESAELVTNLDPT